MMISALKEIEMQFCLILRLCVALMAKADKKVVIFFHYMIDVRFLSNEKMTKTMIFYQFYRASGAFTVIARVDKRLQFSQARKSSTVHRKKITSIPRLKYRVS
ncbi:hypothetical protein GEZ65_14055 [Escherichia albertii]|uniref:hypothetical protein n=1 Tax=Escherichia albertii TaxID=208962 RepID=UPI0003D91CDD|nr:hypothetical protein [Escherichia albertii]AHE62002.1 hypothetical protein EAKF1_ch4187 [Escherichia albertii KF1]EEX2833609.1 hypothetical protein [Escherichia albertii]EFE6907940.1 hypothetical protein [Escherichia albertii]EFF0774958.1 hypothetical protein [Escherichia albertii]EFF0782758.1 hypothetical protein [Escherichia albertii]